MRAIVRDGGASSDSLEAGAERIETRLRSLGHRDALVHASLEPHGSDEAVVYDVQAGEIARAGAVELRGADASLLAGLRTQPGQPLDDAALTEDTRLLRARLEALGHFEARVDVEVADGGGTLPVVFEARPGPRAVVREVRTVSPPLPVSADDRGPEELALREGQPYRLADVARSREALLSAWRRTGHLEVQVTSDVVFSEARDEASVSLVVEPGRRTVVEHVVLAGLDRTRDVTVEREMLLRPGEPFSFERVLESQRRLSSLGIFERVQISELDPGRERRRDVVVSVQEAPRTSWSWGVGWSEQDRLRGSVELTRRNLGGLGRTASVFARGSFRGSRFLLNLREPWLFGRKLDSFLTGFWEEEDRTSFDFNRLGGIVQTGRALDSRTSLILRYLYQDTNVYNIEGSLDEIDRQYRTYTVSGPSASVVFDTRDDPLEPRRGIFLGADMQLSLEALGGVSYVRSFFQAVRVSRLRSDLVFVLSGRVGLAATFADEAPLLPLPERFFAGGDYGPRGFPVDSVGPQVVADGTTYPTGGNAVLLGGAEMRYNVSHSFQLASFLDTGNVYLEARDIALADLRWSAGLGAALPDADRPDPARLGLRPRPAAGRRVPLALPLVDWACLLARLRFCVPRSLALCPFPLSGRSASPCAFCPFPFSGRPASPALRSSVSFPGSSSPCHTLALAQAALEHHDRRARRRGRRRPPAAALGRPRPGARPWPLARGRARGAHRRAADVPRGVAAAAGGGARGRGAARHPGAARPPRRARRSGLRRRPAPADRAPDRDPEVRRVPLPTPAARERRGGARGLRGRPVRGGFVGGGQRTTSASGSSAGRSTSGSRPGCASCARGPTCATWVARRRLPCRSGPARRPHGCARGRRTRSRRRRARPAWPRRCAT